MADVQRLPSLIRELRDRLDLTQQELAAQLKVSLPTVSRWETGRTRPDAMALHVIEEFLRKRGPQCADLLDRYFGERGGAVRSGGRRRKGTRGGTAGGPQAEADKQPGATPGASVDMKSMEAMLWKAACSIRGEKDAPKFKDYILPLVFVKRLSDVFDDEIARLAEIYGDEGTARAAIAALLERIQAAALVQEKRVGSLQTLFSSMLQALVTGQMRIAEGSEVGSRSGSSISRLDTASNERAMPASRSAGLASYTLELARRFHPERIILFGSHADGTATPDSDVDLLVIMDFEGPAAEQAARMDAALDRDFPLDLLVRRPREVQAALAAGDPFLREIVDKGVVLHARPE